MTRTHEKVRYTPKGERYTALTAAQGVEDALKILEGRWKLIILFHLFGGKVLRFSDLERAIPAISQKCSSSNFGKWRGMGSFGGRSISRSRLKWSIA
jgi:DNA-binding HxlR family transcriptional regulator